MVLGVLKNPPSPAFPSSGQAGEQARVGIITSRRVGGAVVRNRVRRRFREIVRLHRPSLVANAWFVIVARQAAANAGFAELEGEWIRLARRAGLLLPSHPGGNSATDTKHPKG